MDKVSLLLKTFVIGSGVVLIVGTVALAALLVLRIGAGPPAAVPATAASGAPPESFVTLPEGARIDQVVPDPARDRLLLLGTDGDGSGFLAVIDPDQGRLLHMVRFRPQPRL